MDLLEQIEESRQAQLNTVSHMGPFDEDERISPLLRMDEMVKRQISVLGSEHLFQRIR